MLCARRWFPFIIAVLFLFPFALPPLAAAGDDMKALAGKVDDLEKDLDKWGYVQVMQPDIWGQARFTAHRVEFEETMRGELGKFDVKLQGSVADADSSMAAMALSIQAALPGPKAHVIQPYEMLRRYLELRRQNVMDQNYGSTTTVTNAGTDASASTETTAKENLEDQAITNTTGGEFNTDSSKNTTVVSPEKKIFPLRLPQRDVIDVPGGAAPESLISGVESINRNNTLGYTPKGFGGDNGLMLEPSLILDQHARYLNHLHELRRINEGDDNADAPGYSLYLVRVPVSVMPSTKTRKGYGARVTLAIEPKLGDRFLQNTFRDLVINDVLDQLSPVICLLANSSEMLRLYRELPSIEKRNEKEKGKPTSASKNGERDRLTSSAEPSGKDPVPNVQQKTDSRKNENRQALWETESASRGVSVHEAIFSGGAISSDRSAPLAYPLSCDDKIFHEYNLLLLADEIAREHERRFGPKTKIQLSEVRAALRAELEGAYGFLSQKANLTRWNACRPVLIDHVTELLTYAKDGPYSTGQTSGERKRKRIERDRKDFLWEIQEGDGFIPQGQAILAWAIVLHSAFLNQRLIEDIKELAATHDDFVIPPSACLDTYRFFPQKDPAPKPSELFNRYVQAKWRTYVFALDPATEDQNVMNQFSQRREMQLAMAMSLASGWFKGQALRRYAHRLERDMEAVSLNRTIVGFGYGEETFGWQFYPRFQTPDQESTLASLVHTNLGTMKSRDGLMRDWRMDSGPRECAAIVVMPSFIREAIMDVRSEWFPIGKEGFPKSLAPANLLRKEGPSLKRALSLSEELQKLNGPDCPAHSCPSDRKGDPVGKWLKRYASRLKDKLPIQTMQFNVPYDRTVSGFELFDWSSGALAPVLEGWHGSTELDLTKGGTFFLTGRHFNTLNTKAIVNNVEAKTTILSREVLEVSVAGGLKVPEGAKDINVQVATPYGVSQPIRVPVFASAETKPSEPGKTGFAWDDSAKPDLRVSYADASSSAPGAVTNLGFEKDSIALLKIQRPGDPAANPDDAHVVFTLYAVNEGGAEAKLSQSKPLPVTFTHGAEVGYIGERTAGENKTPSASAMDTILKPSLKKDLRAGLDAKSVRCKGQLYFGDINKSQPIAIDNTLDIRVIVDK